MRTTKPLRKKGVLSTSAARTLVILRRQADEEREQRKKRIKCSLQRERFFDFNIVQWQPPHHHRRRRLAYARNQCKAILFILSFALRFSPHFLHLLCVNFTYATRARLAILRNIHFEKLNVGLRRRRCRRCLCLLLVLQSQCQMPIKTNDSHFISFVPPPNVSSEYIHVEYICVRCRNEAELCREHEHKMDSASLFRRTHQRNVLKNMPFMRPHVLKMLSLEFDPLAHDIRAASGPAEPVKRPTCIQFMIHL